VLARLPTFALGVHLQVYGRIDDAHSAKNCRELIPQHAVRTIFSPSKESMESEPEEIR
jgi:hypothetical protein